MNERIWQLQGQAKVLAEEIVSQRKYDDYMEYKQSLMDQTMNKFAELIVKECAAEAHRRVCIEGNDNMIYAHLLEHFGVEE